MTISTQPPASPFSAEELATATALLEAERQAILDSVATRHDGSTEKSDVTDGPGETEHLAVAEYQELVNRLDAISEQTLKAIDASLARIADGTYGICGSCGDAIPMERLEALPSAVFCTPCQIANERG
ncbi:MAG: TraR/DksA family transcriptional regulator, partial [Actinobacteria bacterium]|nr:TraR/DksA family transcriptional regulator [Actinomycetota bacterium]